MYLYKLHVHVHVYTLPVVPQCVVCLTLRVAGVRILGQSEQLIEGTVRCSGVLHVLIVTGKVCGYTCTHSLYIVCMYMYTCELYACVYNCIMHDDVCRES